MAATSEQSEEAADKARRRKQIIKTWVIFVVAILVQVGCLLLLKVSRVPVEEATSSWTAQITTGLLRLLGDDSVRLVDGTRIDSKIFGLTIIFECTGLMNVIILVAAVLAFPSTWPAKGLGIIGGTSALMIVNQVRLLSLVFIGHHLTRDQFETFHLVFWQGLMIFVTLGIWLFWASKFVNPNPAAPDAEKAA